MRHKKYKEFICEYCGCTFTANASVASCCGAKDCRYKRDIKNHVKRFGVPPIPRTAEHKKIIESMPNVVRASKKCLKCNRPMPWADFNQGFRLCLNCREINNRYDSIAEGW